jgi:hypothetical protein
MTAVVPEEIHQFAGTPEVCVCVTEIASPTASAGALPLVVNDGSPLASLPTDEAIVPVAPADAPVSTWKVAPVQKLFVRPSHDALSSKPLELELLTTTIARSMVGSNPGFMMTFELNCSAPQKVQ